MSFVSLKFFAIVILTVALYYICPQKYRWYVLLLSSCCFYAAAAGKIAFLTAVLTVLVTYFAGNQIEKSAEDLKKKKLRLACGVIAVLGLLVVFKLKNHFAADIKWIIVPLGVSYYSFSLVGYLADIYFKKSKPEPNILKLTLYALYFPKIMQGPISKFREIGPRLTEGHKFDYQRFCFGLQLILWGYFKKLVIADRAVLLTQTVFGKFSSYKSGGAILIIVTVVAAIRFYCDFSGYMDIVIGISQLMGIELDENFRQPFFSKSAAEFWRRWHITLGAWFKDYVYMPLAINPRVIRLSKWVRSRFGKRAGKSVLTVVPLAVVWLLTGLWHGTGINYILWGMYWGTIIILSNVFAPEIRAAAKFLRIDTEARDWQVFQMVRTFSLFTGGLLLSTFVGYRNIKRYAGIILKQFGLCNLWNGEIYKLGLDKTNLTVLTGAIAILWIAEILQQKGSVREMVAGLHPVTRWFFYALGIFTVIFFGIYGAGYSTTGFAYTYF